MVLIVLAKVNKNFVFATNTDNKFSFAISFTISFCFETKFFVTKKTLFIFVKKQIQMAGIAERRKYILDNILKNGYLKVADLADSLGVTQTTIRKDLTYLEKQGLLYRAYGSALPTATQVMDINLSTKKLMHYDEKQRIGEIANSLLEENDSVILASGSTIAIFAEKIKAKGRLNIVSTSVNISAMLGESAGVSVLQVGGMLYSNTLSVIGADALKTIQNVYCSKAFIGVDGFDPELGLTCGTLEEAELTYQMIRSAKKSIILSDSSKLGQRGFARICGFDEIDTLITDSGLPEEARREIENLGVRVVLA